MQKTSYYSNKKPRALNLPGFLACRQRRWRRTKHARAGGVTTEYVVLAVLIAAAVVVAVVVFSRSVATSFFAAGDGATLRHTKAKQDLDMRRGDLDHGIRVADDYHDSMHD